MWRLFRWVLRNLKTSAGRRRVWQVFLNSLDYLGNSLIAFFKNMKHKKSRKQYIKNIGLLILAFLIVCFGVILLWAVTLKIPDLSSFDSRLFNQSTKIYDSTGNVLLYDLSQEVKRTVVPYDQISPYLKEATVAIEDKGFYQHAGIDPTAILRSFLTDIVTLHFTEGGSTITQQVVKNALLTQDKTVSRKIKEWILSIKLEQVLSKDQILNLYLNSSPYGGTIYGAEEASQTFFGKHAADIDLAEAAYLAALPQAPSYYSPYGPNRAALDDRKNLVLKDMLDQKYITQDQYNEAVNEKVTFLGQTANTIKAPHFVMYIKNYLEQKYGDEMLATGGLKVITTLNYPLEEKAEALAKQYALSNQKTFNASNIALVAIDPTNGQIQAMVGSRDYFDTTIDGQFNVATADRQPGSSFKPIFYAEAFTKGYTPDTIVFDLPTQFSTACSASGVPLSPGASCYTPTNFDGNFAGPISLRSALAQSKNIPSIKVLYLAGIQDSLNLAKQMGITSLSTPDQYGLTLALGGGEVSLLQLTNAYGVFADEGQYNQPTGILSVTDGQGNVLEQFSTSSEPVLSTQVSNQISDVLSDNVARTPEFGATSPLYFPGRDVADKTGTTNDYKDAWVIGYTPHIVVGAWAGNNDDSAMSNQIARYIIVPFWNAVMNQAVLPNVPVETFPAPTSTDPSLKPVLRGILVGANGSSTNPNDIHDILYYVDRSDPTGPNPSNPWADPQAALWDYSVRIWANQHFGNGTTPSGAYPVTDGSTAAD